MAPKGAEWEAAVAYWKTLATDEGAVFDKSVVIDAADIVPNVTWGTSPEDVVPVTGAVPDPESFADASKRAAAQKSLDYMGLSAGQRMEDVVIEHVFIGSCTHSRIGDLRAAAAPLKGRHIASGLKHALGVPSSGMVKRQAEDDGQTGRAKIRDRGGQKV